MPGRNWPQTSARSLTLREISEGRTGTITVGVGEAFTGDAIIAAVNKCRRATPGCALT